MTARTFETDHQRTLTGGAYERPSADSVNGSDNEVESKHAISDRASASTERVRQPSLGDAANL
jgi:hypothetical protein